MHINNVRVRVTIFALLYLSNAHKSGAVKPENDRSEIADALAAPTAPYSIGVISYDKSNKEGFPASGMTRYAAQMYCKWLTATTGRYYRLPTEIEWEYACRCGTDTDFSFGADDSEIDDYAWYLGNSPDGYSKVMTKKPNQWGLYDMHGNVWEWCEDLFAAYSKENVTDPIGDSDYPDRVIRGGSWNYAASECRSETRYGESPKDRGKHLGFRGVVAISN